MEEQNQRQMDIYNEQNIDITRGGQLEIDLNIQYELYGSFLVFFMQCGFALLEAGSVRSRNTKNILLKNVIDACLGALGWYSVGFGIAYGEGSSNSNAFIGTRHFFLSDRRAANNQDTFFMEWFVSFAFCATAATIVSGAMAERTQFRCYLIYTFFMSTVTYPLSVHWIWSKEGWLSPFRTVGGLGDSESDILFSKSMGAIDYAGGGPVHILGGITALVGAFFAGPRYGRFTAEGTVCDMPGHSTALAALGTFILWFGWYGFNTVSTQFMYTEMEVASLIAVNTTLSAGASGLTTLAVHVILGNPLDIVPPLNGILGGLVAITPACAVIEPYAAVLLGFLAGMAYYGGSKLLHRLRIDDPVDAAPVHLMCGILGVIYVGFFATEDNVREAYRAVLTKDGEDELIKPFDFGVIYGGSGRQLGMQLLEVAVNILWGGSLAFIMFNTLRAFSWLRIPHEEEISGLNMSHHGGSLYDQDYSAIKQLATQMGGSRQSGQIQMQQQHQYVGELPPRHRPQQHTVPPSAPENGSRVRNGTPEGAVV